MVELLVTGLIGAVTASCTIALTYARRKPVPLKAQFAPGDLVWYAQASDKVYKGWIVDVADGWYLVAWNEKDTWRFTFEEALTTLRLRNVDDTKSD